MTTLESVLLAASLALVAIGAVLFFAFGKAFGFIGITMGVIGLCAFGIFRGQRE